MLAMLCISGIFFFSLYIKTGVKIKLLNMQSIKRNRQGTLERKRKERKGKEEL